MTDQLSLIDAPGCPTAPEYSRELLARKPTMGHALALAIQLSGLEDKQVCSALDIDRGQWSRILRGSSHFPHNKLVQFCDVVGNDVILDWFALQRGKETRLLQSTAERRIADLEKALAEQEQRNEHYREAMRAMRGG